MVDVEKRDGLTKQTDDMGEQGNHAHQVFDEKSERIIVQGSASKNNQEFSLEAMLPSTKFCANDGEFKGTFVSAEKAQTVGNSHTHQMFDKSSESIKGAVGANFRGSDVSGNRGSNQMQNMARDSRTWANIVATNGVPRTNAGASRLNRRKGQMLGDLGLTAGVLQPDALRGVRVPRHGIKMSSTQDPVIVQPAVLPCHSARFAELLLLPEISRLGTYVKCRTVFGPYPTSYPRWFHALEDDENATGFISDYVRRLKMNRRFSSMATWVRCFGLPWYPVSFQCCKILAGFIFVIFGSQCLVWFDSGFPVVLFSNGFTLISCANRLSSFDFECMSLGLIFDGNGFEAFSGFWTACTLLVWAGEPLFGVGPSSLNGYTGGPHILLWAGFGGSHVVGPNLGFDENLFGPDNLDYLEN
ncbi:hypothetical protein U1Q18_003276 [Sarracenia purpurea var. burkii]